MHLNLALITVDFNAQRQLGILKLLSMTDGRRISAIGRTGSRSDQCKLVLGRSICNLSSSKIDLNTFLVDVNIHLNPQRQRCNSLKIFGYRISSNNGGGRLSIISFLLKKGAIIRARRLFQILLTGSRALHILFYFPIK